MSTIDEAAAALVRAAREAQRDDTPPSAQLGVVITSVPLTVAFDSSINRTVGVPVALAAGVSVSVGNQVLVLWLPLSRAYICMGRVTTP